MKNLQKVIESKQPEREKIQKDVESFIKNGGKVDQVGIGVTTIGSFYTKEKLKTAFKI